MIGREGFAINGITTAYFLPFPSLIRGILSLFNYGASASLSVLIGALTFMLASIGIWGQIFSASALPPTLKTISFLTGIVLCTLLSPIIGMMEYPTAFWEAIVWASALFLMACYFSMLLLNNKNNSFIFFGFTFFCGLTLFTRATFSMASCLLFAFTVIQIIGDTPRKKNKPHHFFLNINNNKILLFNCFLFGSFVCCLLIFNYLKWGNPFEFYPMRYYKMWDEAQKNVQTKKVAPPDLATQSTPPQSFVELRSLTLMQQQRTLSVTTLVTQSTRLFATFLLAVTTLPTVAVDHLILQAV